MDLSDLTLDDVNLRLAHQLWKTDDRKTYKAIQDILLAGHAQNEFLTLKQLQFLYYFDYRTGELNRYKYNL